MHPKNANYPLKDTYQYWISQRQTTYASKECKLFIKEIPNQCWKHLNMTETVKITISLHTKQLWVYGIDFKNKTCFTRQEFPSNSLKTWHITLK
jgi:hypothetical protein